MESESALGRNAALFGQDRAPGTSTYAAFGSMFQAHDLLAELRDLHGSCRHIVEPLLTLVTATLLDLLLTSGPSTRRCYGQGLDVLQWVLSSEKAPSIGYLRSAAVSFPLTGLVQFANYAVVCDKHGLLPGQFARSLRGMAGYSQGVVAAAILARVSDWEEFRHGLLQATTILFHLGSASQEHTPTATVAHSEGVYTPMLHVVDCPRHQLDHNIAALNCQLEPKNRVSIGIINAPSDVVVTGPPLSLSALTAIFHKYDSPHGVDQTRTAFSQRMPSFSFQFLPVSAQLHSSHLAQAASVAVERLASINVVSLGARPLTYNCHPGADLLDIRISDLVQMVFCEQCDWPKATIFEDATHIVDFGPGGTQGVGSLLRRNKEGSGVRVLVAGLPAVTTHDDGNRAELLESRVTLTKSWLEEFGPTLRTQNDGTVRIINKMTRLLGLPPLMVAGMTPTTVSWEFVSSIMNAGYHAELAAGGLHSAVSFTNTIRNLAMSIPQGRGICINVIYASPRQIKWQLPLIRTLRSEGQPIDGITFGAGVPSHEVAQQYVEMGLRYLAFKPGSALAIQAVIDIARANRDFPILLQWTGGRGGGHHSYEDFHSPMLQWYGRIRQCSNIVLLAGSGFGATEDTYPYISGTWSLSFDRPAMPFDGVLFGSRMMVAKEAKTSLKAKEAIVAAPGIADEKLWDQSYAGPCGGIVTVTSEMGEPIHKVATRGVLLWKELDETVFNIRDPAKRLQKLERIKSYVVRRLNEDYQRVWFGKNARGDVVDFEDMTYGEVLRRLVQLLYVSGESRWIDPGYVQLTLSFVERMYSHMPAQDRDRDLAFEAGGFGLSRPLEAIEVICKQCHGIANRGVSYRDARYFTMMCRRPGQKPPTFVLDINQDFEQWFKKDSLWQSEDLASVIDGDAGRTCILQGPVAARYSTRVDAPIQQILDDIYEGHVSKMLCDRYGNDPNAVPRVIPGSWNRPSVPPHCIFHHEGDKMHFQIPLSLSRDLLPDEEAWFRSLAGRPGTWLFDLIMSKNILQGVKVTSNPIRRVLAPLPGMHVELTVSSDGDSIELALRDTVPGEATFNSFTIRREVGIFVEFQIRENLESTTLQVVFLFTHHPALPLHPVHEIMEGRDERLRHLYSRLWFGTRLDNPSVKICSQPLYQSPTHEIKGREQPLTAISIRAFEDSIRHSIWDAPSVLSGDTADIDFAMIIGWEALMETVFAPIVDARFMNLVHLSNELTLLDESLPLTVGDAMSSNARIVAIRDVHIGRIVQVEAVVMRMQTPLVRIVSEFLFRDDFADSLVCFEKKKEQPSLVHVDTRSKSSVLMSKEWIQWKDPGIELLGRKLCFEVESLETVDTTRAWGSVHDQESRQVVGTVQYQTDQRGASAPMDYLKRHACPIDGLRLLEHPQPLRVQDGLEFTSPTSNLAYSRASGDFNPIHTSLPFARYADLPGTITHGMWISAVVRKMVERAAGCKEGVRMRSYKIMFLSMLLPETKVRVEVNLVALKEGRRVLAFEAWNVATEEKVVGGEAVVDQENTAYLFTGQGSQRVGMGMDLSARCKIAKGVWERADRFYSYNYGKTSQFLLLMGGES